MRELFTRYFYRAIVLALAVFSSGLGTVYAVQLSGTYTIDASQPASATNFKTFMSAVTYLTTANARNDQGPANASPFGVSGPVVFIVAPGTYTEQVNISGTNIAGASPVNTVRFQGSNRATCILTFGATVAGAHHTIRLTGTKYVEIRDLTIRSTGTNFGWGVHVNGTGSVGNKIRNCNINIVSGAASSGANFAGVVVSGSTTTTVQGIRVDSLEIDSNMINAGYYGIVTTGLSNNVQQRNKIRGNKVYDSYHYGIFANYQDAVEITGNTVIPRSTNIANNGIGLNNSSAGASFTGAIISGNHVSKFGANGITVNASNNDLLGSSKGQITNNIVGGGVRNPASSAINISASKSWSIANNTLVHDIAAPAAANAALFITGGANISVLNNILAETKGGSGLPFYSFTSGAIDSLDYNIYYHSDTVAGSFIYHSSTLYNSGNFKGVNNYDINSDYYKPDFVSDADFTLLNRCRKGTALPYVSTDIFGNPRLLSPLIGAHEAAELPLNLSLISLNSPGSNASSGLQDFSVKVKNSGSGIIDSFSIAYILNNGAAVTSTWYGVLNPCDTTSIVFTGSKQINISAANYIKTYVVSVNGIPDGNNLDDSMSHKIFTPLSGNYTVGASGDFRSLNDALYALQAKGITGAVNIELQPGIYQGNFVIRGPITGSSPQNTVTIDGINAASSVITSNTSAGATLSINQCSYFTLSNVSVINTNAGNCTALSIGAAISSINNKVAVKKCEISTPNTVLNNTTYGILVTANAAGYGFTDCRLDSLEIDSNIISGSNMGIALAGNNVDVVNLNNSYNRGFRISNNTINTFVLQNDIAINVSSILNGLDITDNNITSPNGTGIQFHRVLNHFAGNRANHITGNRIRASQMGMNFQQITSDSANPMIVANNEISMRSSLSCVGIYYNTITGLQADRIYGNTINIDTASSTLFGYVLYYAGDTSSEIRNNIFSYSGKGSATIYPVYIEKGVKDGNIDNNLYYNAVNDSVIFRNGNAFNAYNYRSNNGGGASSYFEKPAFISNSDLRIDNGCPRGIDVSAVVPDDILKQPRAITPSIGCYEFAGYSNDISIIKHVQPVAPFATGLQDVRIRIANKGSNVVSTFSVSYVLNNGPVVTQNFIGSLSQCDTMPFIFTGANQLNIINGQNTLKVYLSNPNGSVDGNRNNDTITLNFATPLNGTYIIGSVPSDYLSFTSAVNDLQLRGVSGAVTFNVKTGTYNESFAFEAVSGASETNRILFISQAGHRDSVNINYNGTANTAVITYTNASYITLKDLSINQLLDDDYRSTVFMGGDCSFDTIENCNIKLPAYTMFGTIGIYTGAFSGQGLVVKGCNISGGYANVMLNVIDAFMMSGIEHRNATFTGNTLVNANSYAAFFYKSTNLIFSNNNIITNSSASYVEGVSLQGCDSAVRVTANKISGFPGGRAIYLYGGQSSANARPLVANNVVSIGSGTNSSYGIQMESVSFAKVYHNTVNVTSAAPATASAAHFVQCTELDVKNNVLSNVGGGYAIHSTNPYSLNSDYNNLFVTGAILVKDGATNYASIHEWKKAGYRDTNSVSYRPAFTSISDLKPNHSDTACWSLNGRGTHIDSNILVTDIEGNLRPKTTSKGVPDIGAYEIVPSVLPPLATLVPAIALAGDTQIAIFGGDTVAKIFWSAVSPMPQHFSVRLYSGEMPPNVGQNEKHMKFYLDMHDSTSALYNYNIAVYYKKSWLGSLPSENDARLIQYNNAIWVPVTGSQPDVVRNILDGQFLSYLSIITGTDFNDPLPVTLLYLNASVSGNDVVLKWRTTAEKNLLKYEIERLAGNEWKSVNKANAIGSSLVNQYSFTDRDVFSNNLKTVFYRLKMINNDGTFEYSKQVSASINKSLKAVHLFPNPFDSKITVSVDGGSNEKLSVTIYDVTGSVVLEKSFAIGSGENIIETNSFTKGIYFISIVHGNEKRMDKFIKN